MPNKLLRYCGKCQDWEDLCSCGGMKVCKKEIDPTRPVQVRRASGAIAQAKIVDANFLDRTDERPCLLVVFKCYNGTDTAQLFAPDGSVRGRIHASVDPAFLENVPTEKTFYLYEVLYKRTGERKYTMRADKVRWETIGSVKYTFIKEVKVEIP